MKADLNRIKAALQQLAQNPNYCDRVTSNQDDTAANNASDATCKTAPPTPAAPIPPLQPNRKAIALPAFNSLGANNSPSSEENTKTSPTNTERLAITPPSTLMEQVQQVVQQIKNLYMEGPIVDGWLESYSCESTSSNDDRAAYDVATPVEYVKAAGSLEQDQVICEAPRACYRLSGVSETGQQWSYPCPIEQLPSVSVAIARYEKLLQLLERKRNLETQLKEM